MLSVDFKFTLHWFAKDREWRVYSESGQYSTAKTIRRLPGAIRNLILLSCADTIKELKNPEPTTPTETIP